MSFLEFDIVQRLLKDMNYFKLKIEAVIKLLGFINLTFFFGKLL